MLVKQFLFQHLCVYVFVYFFFVFSCEKCRPFLLFFHSQTVQKENKKIKKINAGRVEFCVVSMYVCVCFFFFLSLYQRNSITYTFTQRQQLFIHSYMYRYIFHYSVLFYIYVGVGSKFLYVNFYISFFFVL